MANSQLTASQLRKRNAQSSNAAAAKRGESRPQNSATMLKMYQDDAQNSIKVDPVFVLVGSLTFIASVFILHLVGRFVKV
ncbi:MAG: hypothetical protein SGCHY_004700 [Lobulomycetales sp.]